MTTGQPLLFSPLELRGITLKNRIVISPMCQYSAKDGIANDWHLVHLGKLAEGGAGMVYSEAVAVDPHGRITHGDLGLWSDDQIAPLRRITDFMRAQRCVPAIQLAHAGRKASMQRPWHGNGPLDDSDRARGEDVWPIVAPSELPMDEGWLQPHALTREEISALRARWRSAAARAIAAGFDVVEVHGAHGYLLHEFLSPLSNRREDEYGGPFENRIRLALEIAQDVREVWPADRPVMFRISSVDGVEGGWTIEDSVELAKRLAAVGVDVIDCSSGGLMGSATAARVKRHPGFQVGFASSVRNQASVRTMAVGLILEARQAEEILRNGDADLIAIGREALHNPNWPLHAQAELGVGNAFADWPEQYGWWLDKRQKSLAADTSHR
ncbi:MAG: NADH:flavin oxidoreductase/NADH oxidase [Betaproteobacteria bacterium]|nr:NADH:flavin oxidoreductase/NADH oxidase [Betaproteobacteria bacterium]